MSMELSLFLDEIKKNRDPFFKRSFDRAYDVFLTLGYDKKNADFFINNASEVVMKMREQCWAEFLIEENKFTIYIMKTLIDDEIKKSNTPEIAVRKYIETYYNHIYNLNLSNTQSRRSRAGKEFEEIIELILIGAGVSIDSQGSIGKSYFVEKGLSKLVDAVCPGVVEFEINKRNTVLISAKTTLRERWQEVPEEMGRTGAREMFLATLDDNISDDVLNTLYEANIHVTTTKTIKEKKYKKNNRVLIFEELVKICLEHKKAWEKYNYSEEQIEKSIALLRKQSSDCEKYEFIKNSYIERINYFEELKNI